MSFASLLQSKMLTAGASPAAPAVQAAPAGAISLDALISQTGGKVSKEEFQRLPADLQSAILADPETFLRGQRGETYGASPYDLEQRLGAKYVDANGNVVANDDTTYVDDTGKIRHGDEEVFNNPNFGDKAWFDAQIAANPLTKAGLDPYQWSAYTANGANGDLLSVGAEGGVKSYNNLKWVPGVGLVRPNSDYMQVQDNSADIAGAVVMGALTGGFASVLTPVIGSLGAGAVSAGMNAANASVNGGNAGKAAITGLVGAGINAAASAIPGTTAGVANSTLAGAAGRAALGAAMGQTPGQVVGNLLGNAAGNAVADYTDSKMLGGFASLLTSQGINALTSPAPSANGMINQPAPAPTTPPGAVKVDDLSWGWMTKGVKKA